MIELGKLFIPTLVNWNVKKKRISFDLPEYNTQSYIEDCEGNLEITFVGHTIFLDYYFDNDTRLSNFTEDDEFINGNLNTETFGNIQTRALKKLIEFMNNPSKELLELFN